MYVNKNFDFKSILRFTGGHLVWITVWTVLVACIYHFTSLSLSVPWLPLSVIGTAVAFYIGFKNNQAYDRLWEARKIWGAIVNDSRTWSASIRSYVSNQFTLESVEPDKLHAVHRKMIFRHIAWLYTLRNQLLIPTSWEHISQGKHIGGTARKRMQTYGVGLFEDDITEKHLEKYLESEEREILISYKNTATQIIDKQSQDLQQLRADDWIDDFRHMELQNLLKEFYTHQGKCERIKKFPLPRQYGFMSFVFVGIFIFLLPFGMVSEFRSLGANGIWLSIPFTILVSWVYIVMELVGDYSENPFEGLGNDIPMFSLCRVIEIDLLEMLGEKDLPPAVEPVNGVLM